MIDKRVASLVLAVLLTAARPAWSQPASASPQPDVAEQLIHLDTALSAAKRCRWLTPLQRLGLQGAIRQSRAAIALSEGPEGLAGVEAADRFALESGQDFDCAGPRAKEVSAGVSVMAQEVAATHLYRAVQLLQITQPWAVGIARLKAPPKAIAATVASLKAADPQRMDRVATLNPPTAPLMILTLLCRERKGPNADCPPLNGAPVAALPYARAWLNDTEAFAAAYYAPPKPAAAAPGAQRKTAGPREPAVRPRQP